MSKKPIPDIQEWIASDGAQLWCNEERCKWSTFLERTENHLEEISEAIEEHIEFHLKAKRGRCNFCGKNQDLTDDGLIAPHLAFVSSYGGTYEKWKSSKCPKGGYPPRELIRAVAAIYLWGKEL